jgi:hypothetical protein
MPEDDSSNLLVGWIERDNSGLKRVASSDVVQRSERNTTLFFRT